jgi:hypothetical protein
MRPAHLVQIVAALLVVGVGGCFVASLVPIKPREFEPGLLDPNGGKPNPCPGPLPPCPAGPVPPAEWMRKCPPGGPAQGQHVPPPGAWQHRPVVGPVLPPPQAPPASPQPPPSTRRWPWRLTFALGGGLIVFIALVWWFNRRD